jgi:hypothetical protein
MLVKDVLDIKENRNQKSFIHFVPIFFSAVSYICKWRVGSNFILFTKLAFS